MSTKTASTTASTTASPTAPARVTEMKPAAAAGSDHAATRMYEALMYIMHHPTQCSATVWDLARQALVEAGMNYERDVATARDDRIRDAATRIEDANDPYYYLRRRRLVSPTEPEPSPEP